LHTVKLGSQELFRTVREALDSAGYDEATVCRLFDIESLEHFEEEFEREQANPSDDSAAAALTRLFIQGHYVDAELLLRLLNSEALQAMADLGLLEHHPHNESEISSTVSLYPTDGVYLISDRWNRPDRSAFVPGADVVYPAIVSNAQRFLRLMPRMSCERFLDLCSGTAIAALTAADNFAGHAWAFDIAERSTHFGEFNRRLNDIPNVTVDTGDLYAPAGDLKFDRIVAHPPYVPVLRPKWIYHDGGEDGEQIMRRVVAGLPEYLEPGGLFYMLAMGSDRELPFERRVREWLGEAADEFDVAVFPSRLLEPEDFAVRAALKSQTAADDVREFKRLFASVGVKSLVYAALFLQRRESPRPVFTVRRQTVKGTGTSEMMAAIELETMLVQPDGCDRILGSRPVANPRTELRVVHRLVAEGWEASEHVLQSAHPFSMEARTDPWAPYLIALCDGKRTVLEHLDDLKQAGAIAPDAPPTEFARAVAVLISGGFLRMGSRP
jgi:carbamoyltransferase